MEQASRGRVVVVGAGIGGLCAAARLARQGYQVRVFEKNPEPGGRAGQIRLNGFVFDTGPTLLLMSEVLRETFAALGRDLRDYVTLEQCRPNYRVHFRDGERITFGSDLALMSQELERIEPGSFPRYLAFLQAGEQRYRVSVERFVSRNFDHIWGLFTPSNARQLMALRTHRSMYADVAQYFRDPRLRAALTFQTMYLGMSPFVSPAVYSLLPFTELAHGIWFARGGIYTLVKALEAVAQELGVQFFYNQSVTRITTQTGRVGGVLLSNGQEVAADAVLCNADLPWAYNHLLDERATPPARFERLKYTSGAYMFYWGMRRRCEALQHHNVFMGGDYAQSFKDIFQAHRVPDDPSFYVNAPAHTDASLAPAGKDALYVLVPVPHLHPGIDWQKEGAAVRRKVLSRLEQAGIGALEQEIETERTLSPPDFLRVWNLERGAAFGLSHSFFQVGPFRPRNQHPQLRNLFFVGASTQPGTGVPLVMLSAKLAVERIMAFTGAAALPCDTSAGCTRRASAA